MNPILISSRSAHKVSFGTLALKFSHPPGYISIIDEALNFIDMPSTRTAIAFYPL
jgi:hypothetical protein